MSDRFFSDVWKNFRLRRCALKQSDRLGPTCATMLCVHLGPIKKAVKPGPNSGYDPNVDIPLEFELWAGLRHNVFAAGPPLYDTWKSQLDFKVDVESRGLHISNLCDDAVRTQRGLSLEACISGVFTRGSLTACLQAT
jgi:hypothetical protein